jgi:signal transduction histidine kinase/CheY-like chemotaxis protein
MTNSEKIFKNRILLNFYNSDLEEKFSYYLKEILLKYNIWFSILGLTLSIIDLVYESIFYEEIRNKPELKYIYHTRIMSFVITGIFLIQCPLSCLIKNYYYQKSIIHLNYILILFPFQNLREILFDQKHIEQNVFSLMRILEVLVRVTLVLLLLVTVPETYIMNLIFLVVACIYVPFISGPQGISTYSAVAIILIIVSYFYTKQVKTNFYINHMIQEQNEWFSNLLEHMNSGFLAFSSKKIKFINSNLYDLINKLKNGSHKNSLNLETDEKGISSEENYNKVLNPDKNNKFEENISLQINEKRKGTLNSEKKNSFKNFDFEIPEGKGKNFIQSQHTVEENEKKTHEILTLLLNNIKKDYCKNCSPLIDEVKFDLEYFLKETKKVYRESKMNQKFLLIGYQEFVILKEKNEIILDKENVEKLDFSRSQIQRKKEIRNFEIYFRCHIKESINTSANNSHNSNSDSNNFEQEEQFEIIFNDITKIIKNEERSAELKYKTMFLSKIAHEFKNPLICISELAELIRQEKSYTQINIEESKGTYLKQIKSLSDYLLILIKDLNYFSFSNLGIELNLDKKEADIEEILNFCKNVGEVLLLKFNKKDVSIVISKNFKGIFKFITDSVKLKQVLINLISNSVKYTNIGKIEIIVNYINFLINNPESSSSNINSNKINKLLPEQKNEEFLEFKIKDTGIGITEDRIRKFLEPLGSNKSLSIKNTADKGLGLFIVQEILKQFNSKLEIESSYGEGSIFSFKILIKKLTPDQSGGNYNSIPQRSLSIIPSNSMEEGDQVSPSASINFKRRNSEESHSHDEESIETRKLNLDEINLQSNYRSPSNGSNLQPDEYLQSQNQNNQHISINNNYNVVFNLDPGYRATKPDTLEHDGLSFLEMADPNTKFLIIVDDEKFTRKSSARIIKKTLQKYFPLENENLSFNYTLKIIESEDGVECLYTIYKLMKSGSRNITVLSDENMVHMNGSTCAETLKKLKNFNADTIPFILLTAYHEINCSYIDYFISKPLCELEAKKILSQYVGLRQLD